MEICKIKIEDIIPYENNVKEHPAEQIEQLKNSIIEFGNNDPIAIDENNIIIEGHGRLMALKELGYEEVECIVIPGLTEEQKNAYRIVHNQLTMNTGFDMEALKKELNKINLNMIEFGLSEDLLDEMFDKDAEDDNFDLEEALEEIEEPITQYGDIYKLGNHYLMCGDSTKKEDILKLMQGNKADMVFTDPPYNALKSWKKDEARAETRLNPNDWFANDNMSWEEYSIFLDNLFKSFTGHSVYICCDFRIYPIILEALAKTPYDLKHCIVWKKNIWGLGKRYRFQHEFIVYGCIDKAPFTGDRSQSDVWEVDVDRTTEHKTPKPIGIPAKAIINSSCENQRVLDVCGGSGSTLIACEQLNRKCYMMELDPKYCDVIIKRWEQLTGGKAELIKD